MASTPIHSPHDLLAHVARRHPAARELSVRQLEASLAAAGVPLARTAIIAMLRALASESLGRFVTGRHGRESRMLWAARPRDLAAPGGSPDVVAPGRADGPTPAVPDPPPTRVSAPTVAADDPTPSPRFPTEPTQPAAGPPAALRLAAVPVELRPGFVVSLTVPADLSVREAEYLAGVLRGLARPDAGG